MIFEFFPTLFLAVPSDFLRKFFSSIPPSVISCPLLLPTDFRSNGYTHTNSSTFCSSLYLSFRSIKLLHDIKQLRLVLRHQNIEMYPSRFNYFGTCEYVSPLWGRRNCYQINRKSRRWVSSWCKVKVIVLVQKWKGNINIFDTPLTPPPTPLRHCTLSYFVNLRKPHSLKCTGKIMHRYSLKSSKLPTPLQITIMHPDLSEVL